ncbi:MAG: penicillin-binding transpeptidase domain-containing protein [Eubacteriales bacterium]
MKNSMENRYKIFGIILFAMFMVLIFTLAKLTIVNGEDYLELSENRKRKTVAVQGTRGSIMDRNGLPLAYDEKSFNVSVVKDPTINSTAARAYYTDIFIKAIDIVESHDGTIVDSFVIKRDDDGNFYFDFGIENAEAKKRREASWRTNMFVGNDRTPEEIYVELRARFLIPEEYSYEEARKLLSIWQEVQLSSYRAYVPVTIAEDVDFYTVSEIETRGNELEGVTIEEDTVRTYVQGDVAAHVIGYLGKINTAEAAEAYSAKGYDLDNLVGIAGIEAAMEDVLTGNSTERQGTQEVEVNSRGAITKVLTSTPASQGNSVMLTIDIGLQMAVEESLASNVPEIEEYEHQLIRNRPWRYSEFIAEDDDEDAVEIGGVKYDIDFANSGAAVVMDVRSGEILAIASYPSYDLNLFTGGISDENYQALATDPAAPLFNKAVYTQIAPGSVFKLATALGALMNEESGITLETRIDDLGPYTKYVIHGRSMQCWVAPNFHLHVNQDLSDGLMNSCNYYFYTIGDAAGIDSINEWSDKLGLTSSTGIELVGEPVGQVGNQTVLYDNTKSVYEQATSIPYLVHRLLRTQLREIAAYRGVEYTDDEIFNTASKLLKVAGSGTTQTGPAIRRILFEEMNISETMTHQRLWDKAIASILTELQWNPNQTLATSIGQGVTSVTPLELVRYVGAAANSGTVYNLHLVDKIISPEGEVIEEIEPSIFSELDDVPEEIWQEMRQGMRDVVQKGTAATYFEGYEYIDEIGGKTGTAETNIIDIENSAWFIAFAPYDEPEIAICVMIPRGYSGGLASLVAQDIVTYYLDKKKEAAPETVPEINEPVIQ